MNAAVEIGAVTTRKGARLHVAAGCYWSQLLPVVGVVELTAKNAHRTCGNCRKAIRTALDTARKLNSDRTASSHVIAFDKEEVDAYLSTLVQLFRTAAEMVRDAELVARYHAPVEPVEVFTSVGRSGAVYRAPVAVAEPDLISLIDATPVKPKSAFAAAVERMGARSVRPTVRRRPATKRTSNVHAKFAA